MKTLKYSKDKFLVKTFDTKKKKGSVVEIIMPEQIWRIATKFYGYVALDNDILMCGGQFIEDKACSIDTYKIEVNKNTLRDTKQYMKVARMHHSMIYVEEVGHILVAGGEDENGGLLDSCEILNKYDVEWKTLNSLNCKAKNVGLCKFVVESKPLYKIYIYAFGRSGVERIEMSKTSTLDSRWEELNIKAKETFPLPLMSNSLQFNESYIIINGGIDSLGSATKEVLFFDTHNNIIKKVTSELQVNDKFTGAAMT